MLIEEKVRKDLADLKLRLLQVTPDRFGVGLELGGIEHFFRRVGISSSLNEANAILGSGSHYDGFAIFES